MGLAKFERLFRAAGGVSVDRDVNRYLDFVNDAIYGLMVIGQATAKASVRDVIEPGDLPITKGAAVEHAPVRKTRRGDRTPAHPRTPGRPATA
jgi:hypothetical protein